MKVILTRAEVIQAMITACTVAREVDNGEWGVTKSTPDNLVIERFLELNPEFKYCELTNTYTAEISPEKLIAIYKVIDNNIGDLARIGKGIWMMIQGFSGSIKRIGREIEAITRK